MRAITFRELPAPDQELVERAAEAMEHAYAPYSEFYVGAAVRTTGDRIFVGANVETASYVGVCAESAAIAAAVAQGQYGIRTLALISRSRYYDVTRIAGPCGSCRQLINEFAQVRDAAIEILCTGTRKDRVLVATIADLLPLSFGPIDTETDVSRYRR